MQVDLRYYTICPYCKNFVHKNHIHFCKENLEREKNLEKLAPMRFRKGNVPWNKGKKTPQVGWSRGLTKHTDKRLMKAAISRKIRSEVSTFFRDDTRQRIPSELFDHYKNCWEGLKTKEDWVKSFRRMFERAIRQRFCELLWFIYQDSAFNADLDEIDKIILEEFGRENFSSIMLGEGLVTWHHSITTYCLSRKGIRYYGVSVEDSVPFSK